MTYIRRERDWLDRARADGRIVDPGRLLPVLPAAIVAERGARRGNGNGHRTATRTDTPAVEPARDRSRSHEVADPDGRSEVPIRTPALRREDRVAIPTRCRSSIRLGRHPVRRPGAVMIGSALLVVTLRDIIRCGLAMIVCFAVAGRAVRPARRPARRRDPGPGLHRRDQRPGPVRDHADPDQERPRRGSSSRPRPCPPRSPRSSSPWSSPLTVVAHELDASARRAGSDRDHRRRHDAVRASTSCRSRS